MLKIHGFAWQDFIIDHTSRQPEHSAKAETGQILADVWRYSQVSSNMDMTARVSHLEQLKDVLGLKYGDVLVITSPAKCQTFRRSIKFRPEQ